MPRCSRTRAGAATVARPTYDAANQLASVIQVNHPDSAHNTSSYDSLGRLTDAHTTGTQWGQTFAYDGFGNLTDETRIAGKLAGPTVHRSYDPATNRLTLDYTYDANGNMLTMPGLAMTYNVENRLTQATSNLNGTESYGYDAAGLRLWKQGPDAVTHVYYNGLDGKPLADFYLSGGSMAGGTPMVYFAGKRVDNQSVEDRLGTAVVEGGTNAMAYFPYGEQRSGTSTEVQFATYKRDSTTNLDYAHQRYYSTQIGRFTTPDPEDGSADPQIPQSWNRYSYALGDPVNNTDRNGTDVDENGQDYGFIGGTIAPTGFSNYGTNVYPGFGSGGSYVDEGAVDEGFYANSIAPWMTPSVPSPNAPSQNPFGPSFIAPLLSKDCVQAALRYVIMAGEVPGGGYGTLVGGTVISGGDAYGLPAGTAVPAVNNLIDPNTLSGHPGIMVQWAQGQKPSSAFGAFQITLTTARNYGFTDFSVSGQIAAANKLMDVRNMIGPALAGDPYNALLNGNKEWAPLPESPYNQNPMSWDRAMELWNAFVETAPDCNPLPQQP